MSKQLPKVEQYNYYVQAIYPASLFPQVNPQKGIDDLEQARRLAAGFANELLEDNNPPGIPAIVRIVKDTPDKHNVIAIWLVADGVVREIEMKTDEKEEDK
jgi:hypothetical protein